MNNVNTRSSLRFSLLLALMVIAGSLRSFAQPHQDCHDAIPICQTVYLENNTYVGAGNTVNEINPGLTCTITENNSSWYIITCQTAGFLGFLLTPGDPTANFDWAVFNQSGSFTCSNFYTNPALTIRCNSDPTPGATGMCGGAGPQNNPMYNVLTAGSTYIICIINTSGSLGGFTLDFSCSTAQIIDNVPPHMASITSPIPCLATTIKVRMSEEVQCSTATTVSPVVFYVTDPISVVHNVIAIASTNCTNGFPYDNYYTLTISPALTIAGTYQLHINVGLVEDLCGNFAAAGTINFNIAGVTVSAHHTNAGCACNASDTIHINTGIGPFTYTWSCTSGNYNSNIISGLCAGDICTCTVHGNSGCPGVVIDSIVSGSTFSLTTASVNSGCTNPTGQASVAPVNGTGPYLFSWTTGGTDDSIINIASGSYTVTVTDQGTGCVDSATVVVSAGGGMSAIASASNVNCANALNGSVNVIVIGSGVFTFSWSPSGATTDHVNHLGPGIYTVTVTDSLSGCTVTATCTISIVGGISVTAFSNSVCCPAANNAVVWETVTGNAAGYPYLYHWSPSNASTPTVSNLTVSTYNVTVTDTNGCTATASVTIPVTNSLTNSNSNFFNPTCNNPGWVQANPSGCAGFGYTYHWSANAGNSTNQTVFNLYAGTYTVTITDPSSGCTITDTYTLTVTSNLTITMHSTNVLCHGGATGTAWETIGNGNNIYTYVWTPSGGSSATAANLAPGNYTVTVSETTGCSVIGYVTITEPPALLLSMSSLTSSCGQANGSAIAIPDSGTGPYTYIWNTAPVQNTDTAIHLVPGTYVCTVTDHNGCTIVDSVIVGTVGGPTASITSHTNVSCFGGADGTAIGNAVGGTGPYTYSWSSSPIQNTDTASNLPIGTFTVIVTDATGCTSTDTVTLTSPTAVTLIVGGATTECVGDSSVITATAAGGMGGYTYNWGIAGNGSSLTVTPLVTTTYTCTATDINGCNSPAESITITVLPPITVVAFGPSDTVCSGKKVSITATASGGNNGPYTYTWSPGGLIGNPVTVSPTITTTYTCTVNDGCTKIPGTTVIAIEIIPVPLVNFKMSSLIGCEPLEVKFTNLSLNVRAGSTYSWDFGGLGSDTANNPIFIMRVSGLFDITLTITTPEGCTTTLTDTNAIHVLPKPIAIITADPLLTTKSNANVNFYNNSVGATIWDWNFGDFKTSTSTLKDPSFTYLDTGIFRANLVATNLYGCTDTAYINIHIKDDFSFFIPSAFSPDADGVNDYFTPTGIGVTDYVMYIFDRYGNQIFQTTDMSIPWDGTVSSGAKAPENVYVYWIQNSDREGNKHQYTGRVTLLR